MKGQNITKIINDLYKHGWQILDDEEGWIRFVKYGKDTTSILEICYIDNTITGTYKYSY